LIQTLSPAAMLGRVSGLYQSTIISAQLIGTILTSAVVPGLIAVDAYFALVALLIMAVAIFGLLFYLRISRTQKPLIVLSEE
jgi:hypothetical protein